MRSRALAYLPDISEFQGFKISVKQVIIYFLLAFFASGPVLAQKKGKDTPDDRDAAVAPTVLDFQDSVKAVLARTRGGDAIAVGEAFATAWGSLGPDQQRTVRRQVQQLRKKRFPLKPHTIDFLGAVAHAVNTEHADAATIASFLSVTEQVIASEASAKAQNFFRESRTFFQCHALHYEKPFRLYARDDRYTFEYITPAPAFDMNDTTSSNLDVQNNQDPQPTTDSYSDPSSDTVYNETPLWANPPPPPVVEGPIIRFSQISLNFVTRYDSVTLKNSKGMLSLRNNLFVGENGRFDWSPALLSPDSVYADLTTYNFPVNKPELKSDLAKLNYIGRTPGAIPGTFEFKSIARKDSVASTYPRFKSFQSTLTIQGMGDENVKYRGGFSLTGNKISSASVGGEDAIIEVFHAGEKKFTARSQNFMFNDSTIGSNASRIAIYQKRDSITHPSVRLRYRFGRDSLQTLAVQKDKGKWAHTPYSASFFKVDFAADVIRWNMYSDSMNIMIDGGRNTVPMIVESTDFYDADDFRLLKGEGFSFHPLALVANYCMKNKVREFYSGDLVSWSNKEPRDIKAAIEFLSEKGLISYSSKTDVVKVKERAIRMYKAFRGEMDYDNLKIHSVIDSLPNATVNFEKGYMTVRGVEEFEMSDSLNVRIEPDSAVITLLQNRDMKFNGTINAGNFEISGKNFMMNYDNFYIELGHIDSINFFVTEKNAKGQETRRKINNSMVGTDSTAAAAGGLANTSATSGTLFISKANNKSGKEKIPNYPRLDASSGGVIYFDRKEVLNGAYDRSMFFVVPPFKLDSLNDADPASINFDGTFVSSGMFPNFKEKLHTQPDKSLGFEHIIPKPGYRMYAGEGNMNGVLTMDNRGLRGTGQINYLAATMSSYDFIFYPDSVIARGDKAQIDQKQFGSVLFPQANLTDFDMKWYPKEDRMRLKNLKAPFEFYNGTAQMQGSLTISKNGVAGTGKFETRGTELISRTMNFTGNDFSARHGRFKVKSEDPNKPLLSGTDIRMKFNLEQNYADISPEVEGVAAIDFPYAQFKTSIPEMRWNVNEQKIFMKKAADVPLEKSYFYTTRKELDSLHFNAESAVYDLKTQELKVSGIPYIVVADAKITPENNEVLILENAKIGTLKNTTIVLDTLNGYHRLTEGVVDIISRKEFTGYATYQYVNFLKDTFAIKMTNFHLEPITQVEQSRRSQRRKSSVATMQTVGTGAVTDKDNIVLGAGMFYKGELTMYATRPALQLTGFVKLDIKRIKNYNTWIQYNQTGDETDVLIDYGSALTEEGMKVNAGLHFNSTDNNLYITFLSNKLSDDDENFFEPVGTLYYDTASKEFKIEDIEKARGNKLSGKVFAYNDEKLAVRFEGPVKLFNNPLKDFSITSTAIGQGNLETNDIKMNSFLMMDTNVPVAAFDIMAKQLQEVIKNEGADEGLGDQTELLYKIGDIVGEKMVKDYETNSGKGYVSLGTLAPLAKPLVLSNVNLKWSQERKAFYSEGKIGVSNSGRLDINGAFEGFVEARKNEDGSPVFHVFFKASPEAWYYFGFEDNRLMIQSSNEEFNNIITKKSNAGKAKIGEVAFMPGSDEETLTFINRFRRDYYGIDIPYNLSEGAEPAVKKEEKTEKKASDDGF